MREGIAPDKRAAEYSDEQHDAASKQIYEEIAGQIAVLAEGRRSSDE